LLFGCVATFGGACWYTTRNVTHLVLRETERASADQVGRPLDHRRRRRGNGLTAEWHDWAGDHPMPQLGDFAVLKVKEEGEPAVALGGLFNESWKLQ